MEEKEIKERLLKENKEFRNAFDQHLKLEKKLSKFQAKSYLTEEEKMEEDKIQSQDSRSQSKEGPSWRGTSGKRHCSSEKRNRPKAAPLRHNQMRKDTASQEREGGNSLLPKDRCNQPYQRA